MNEDKEKIEEEKQSQETKVEAIANEEKVTETKCESGKKCCGGKCKVAKFVKKNKTAVAIVVLLVLITASAGYKYLPKQKTLKPEEAKGKIEKFIKENLVQPGTDVVIKEVTPEGDLYKVVVTVSKQDITAYMTKDGSKFFPQVIEVDKNPNQAAGADQAATQEKAEAEVKTDMPTVDLFVMSYCPYGLQMEKGLLPAVEALGNKIKFNLKFVGYTLHGPKEVTENTNQYCIQKTQPAKLDSYLKCFWKDSKGNSDACMKSVGINAVQVSSCVAETNKQFSPTEKDFTLTKEDATKYGVQGSPTLVVNGTTLSSGRDSASVLKAICSGFKDQPKECSAKLSATSPTAGFDDQNAGSGSGSAAASCH